MKCMLIIVFMVLFLVPTGRSEEHYPGKLVSASEREGLGSTTNDTVIVDSQNSWLTGILVGNLGSREWVNGVLWSSGELAVHATETSEFPQYPSFQYALSVEESDQELWMALVETREPEVFVFSFRSKAFWSSPFSSESDFILTEIVPVVEEFSVSHSAKAFPEGVEVDWDYRNNWFYRERVSRGLVTRVQRINRSWLSNQCIIDIHLGGSRNIVSYRDEWIPEKRLPSQSEGSETGNYLGVRKEHQFVPDVGQFTTYQESFCRYAEDAAASNQEVNILYSAFWDSSESLVEAEVYKIWVEASE